MLDHFLSMLVFLAALAEFLLVKEAATSTFAVITAICLVDLAEGLAISGRAARHRRTIGRLEAPAPGQSTGFRPRRPARNPQSTSLFIFPGARPVSPRQPSRQPRT